MFPRTNPNGGQALYFGCEWRQTEFGLTRSVISRADARPLLGAARTIKQNGETEEQSEDGRREDGVMSGSSAGDERAPARYLDVPLFRLLGWYAIASLGVNLLGRALLLGPLEQSVFWPGTGLLLGVLVISSRERWVWLVLVAAASDVLVGFAFDLALGRKTSFGWLLYFAAATIVVALATAVLMRWIIGTKGWNARCIMVAMALAGLASALGAMAGVVGLTAIGGSRAALAAQLWWTSDMLGIVAVAPVIVTAWLRHHSLHADEGEASKTELASLIVVAAFVMLLVFGNTAEAGLWHSPFILVPVLFWAAVRFPPTIVALLNFALALVGSAFTKLGFGTFYVSMPPTIVSAVPLQFFLVVVLTSTFVMSVAIEGRRIALAHYARADRRLRAAVRRLTDADERARRQAAEDLHDSIGQSTVAARLMLENALRSSQPDPLRSAASEVSQILQNAQDEIRSLIRSLAPPPVARLGLEGALAGLANEFRSERGVDVSLALEGDLDRVPSTLGTLVYRWVRELLLNVSKHARTTSADVRVALRGDEVVVEVQDEGSGFDAERVLAGEGEASSFGLESIVDRAIALGGEAEVDSRPGQGCRVTIAVPLVREGGGVEQVRERVH
jgi:signal transduction histidine kinase